MMGHGQLVILMKMQTPMLLYKGFCKTHTIQNRIPFTQKSVEIGQFDSGKMISKLRQCIFAISEQI